MKALSINECSCYSEITKLSFRPNVCLYIAKTCGTRAKNTTCFVTPYPTDPLKMVLTPQKIHDLKKKKKKKKNLVEELSVLF